MTTTPFVSEANKLKNIQLNLEKTEPVLIEHIRKYHDSRLVEFCRDLEILRKKETEMIRNEVRSIFLPLNRVKNIIQEGEIESMDLKQLKGDLLSIQNNIQNLNRKTKPNLENLKKDEKDLFEELKTYEQKMQEWGKSISITSGSYKIDATIKNSKIDQSVNDFLTFVTKNGGHENGWNSEDHNLFLKIRAKCKNEQEVAEYVHAILPDISEENIVAHEHWYIKYLALKAKHREGIKNWRQMKSAPQTIPIKQVDLKTRSVSALSKESSLTREQIQEKLEVWKQEKKEKLENERKLILQAKLRVKHLEEKRKLKNEDLKMGVKNWRMANAEKEQAEKSEQLSLEQQEKEFKTALANRLIKEFRSQDKLFMKRKKESCKPKVKTSVKSSNSNILVPRDPSRLFKPTKQWILRINRDENSKIKDICNIKHVPKLGVPEWRKHLIT